jgi:PEGA domain-containing protein
MGLSRLEASRIVAAAALCAVACAAAGCATIVNGRSQAVTVSSEPSGARVFIGSQLVGVTPARLELKRRDDRVVLHLEKDGFSPEDIALKRSVSAWIAGNAVGGNPLSCQGLDSLDACPAVLAANIGTLMAIDFLTGAAYKHPKTVRAVLKPLADR